MTGQALTGQALTGQALTGQALTGQALTGQALTGQALTGQALTGQALTGQALTGQALTGQALTGQALTGQALTGQALTGQALTGQALTGREHAQRLALPRAMSPARECLGGLPCRGLSGRKDRLGTHPKRGRTGLGLCLVRGLGRSEVGAGRPWAFRSIRAWYRRVRGRADRGLLVDLLDGCPVPYASTEAKDRWS
ncbi:hypothetical protein J116_010680 [Streptomyces thermolilacinus SPC6]|uniref:Uncharacterized protein n=1 Tax=Streptomyces thermolilacinus SPC6 TaxID=1306406 RepID=A0A1D3DRD8_9ACTN|nr:hypothetical protein J116_010680 [Streptomyces thermolilacinus SPC6]